MTATQAPAAADQRRGLLVGLLALTAGATDAVSFLALGGVFSSVMTANMALLGLSAGLRDGALAAHSAVALAGYVAGALAASGLVRVREPATVPASGRITAALVAEFIVLVGFTSGWELTSGRPAGATAMILLASAALAMGSQSATVLSLRISGISTTYMTGMLTGILGDLATSGRHGLSYRLGLLALLIAGAAASGVIFAHEPLLVPLILLAPLLAAILISVRAAVGGSG